MRRTWHVVLAAAALVSRLDAVDVRGLSPALQEQFGAASAFTCDDGTKTLPIERLNDNYCDCDDGGDEPGTSACSHTNVKFYCANKGFLPKSIPTSTVNDQICDCCDGSDEYASGAKCLNTCSMRMAEHQAKVRAKMSVFNRGFEERQKLVVAAAAQRKKDEDERNLLEKETETQQAALKQLETVKTQEEALEEQERKTKRHAVETEMLMTLGLMDLSVEQLGMMVIDLVQASGAHDDLLKRVREHREGRAPSKIDEEEAMWKKRDVEREEETKRIEALREKRKEEKEAREKTRQEAIDRGETPPEEPVVEEEELVTPVVEERPIKKMFERVTHISTHEREEAKTARTAYTESNDALTKSQDRLTTLKARLERAYGEQDVLYSLHEQCFSTDPAEYTYTICIYGDAKQDSTSLGTMEPYDPINPYELAFKHGMSCWNGPERSITIKMECGQEPKLEKVEEPSTCVYTAIFKTPIACDEHTKQQLMADESNGVVEVEVEPKL